MFAKVAPSGECLRGKGPPDRMLAQPGCCCCSAWQSVCHVIAALCADCCMSYTVCNVEQFVLTSIKRRLLLSSSQKSMAYAAVIMKLKLTAKLW